MSDSWWWFAVMKGTELVFEMKVPAHRLARDEVNNVMRMLLAKYALTDEQIVTGSLNKRRGGPAKSGHLTIQLMRQNSTGRRMLRCGAEPYVLATNDYLSEPNAAWVATEVTP